MSERDEFEGLGIPADCHPKIGEAVAYWLSIKPDGGLPGRQHFDPTDIPRLLRGVWLIDVQRDPLSFVFRLVGTGVVEFFGADPTGENLNDVFEDFPETVACKDFRQVVETGAPSWRRGTPQLRHESKFSRLERVYLPLARNGKEVDLIFCLSVFDKTGNGGGR
ncbi:MAG: PAS domain-containing protein [Gammaproteobacteria bacterium]|jgi:hypothetical protein